MMSRTSFDLAVAVFTSATNGSQKSPIAARLVGVCFLCLVSTDLGYRPAMGGRIDTSAEYLFRGDPRGFRNRPYFRNQFTGPQNTLDLRSFESQPHLAYNRSRTDGEANQIEQFQMSNLR